MYMTYAHTIMQFKTYRKETKFHVNDHRAQINFAESGMKNQHTIF